ncbi:StAR-related lipid transfer protein, putative [Plasmodium ovale]|uniref:StAR-related lipid transfer protein, putative n=1 Tax=Plasmodium ovale TaxID=36330 RepID=A0A1C3KMU2_PLAOA|nr:StAR-related lipid transfer protein, putative [Plasmodium ovale]
MIFKKSKFIVLTFFLAFVKYARHDGEYKSKIKIDLTKIVRNELSFLSLWGSSSGSGIGSGSGSGSRIGSRSESESESEGGMWKDHQCYPVWSRLEIRVLSEVSQSDHISGGGVKTDVREIEEVLETKGEAALEQENSSVTSTRVRDNTDTESLPEEKKTIITKPSVLIGDETVNHYLNVCEQIRNKSFSYQNCEIFHESQEVTLYKNILEDKSETRYDLVGHGTLNDVSLYGLSYALNNMDTIKEWNKNIYQINYLNLTKNVIEENYQNDEMLDATKFLLKNDKDAPRGNRKYVYLVNGLPWPFRSHDTVYEFYQKYYEEKNMLLVANRSINPAFKENGSYTRINNYENFFCIYPKSNNSYEKGLDYVLSIYYDVNIPKFLQNKILSQIFPSLLFSLHSSSKALTEKGESLTEEEMKNNELPFELKESQGSDSRYSDKANPGGELEQSSYFGTGIIRIIFVNPVYFIWSANVNFFKRIYVFFTSMF